MGAMEDQQVIRRGYDAFIAGDMDTLGTLFANDAVWHVGGTGALSGDKRGKDEIFSYFGELFSRSGGTLKVALEDIIAGADHTVGVQTNRAERDDRALNQRVIILFTLRDGKVLEGREFTEDTAANSEFWS